jgi:hypothetical protein
MKIKMCFTVASNGSKLRTYSGDITYKHAKYAALGAIRYQVKTVYLLLLCFFFGLWKFSDAGGNVCWL